jgi:hypothetical protein
MLNNIADVQRVSAMRLVVSLCAVLLFVGSAAAVRAQPHAGPDGFSICPFVNADTGSCAPLTNQAVQSFGLSEPQAGVVAILKQFAVKPDAGLLEQLAKTFAQPQSAASAGTYSDIWLADRGPGNAASDCFICGIHLRYRNKELYQMTYTVEDKFTVLWNKPQASSPAQ